MTPPDEDYARRERLLLQQSTPSSSTSSSSSSSVPPTPPTPQYPPGERFNGERFERYPPYPERYTPDRERYAERYQNGYSDRYIPPPAPTSDRYQNNGVVERFSKSPNGERFQNERYFNFPSDRYPPPPAPNERYVPADRYPSFPPSPGFLPNGFIPPTTPVNPGDPYMRRDLGYHHHYRLPHPNYHHYHHYHRALPPAPHHRYHQHILPSPNRSNHLRCCPSPNHQTVSPLTTVNSTSSQTTVSNSSTSTSGSREYLTSSPSSQRGRTTPRLSSVASTPVEYVGASGGRHVSTPPPTAVLPRCASMSNCDVDSATLCEHKVGHCRRAAAGDGLDGSTMSLQCCARSTPAHAHSTLHHAAVWRSVGQPQTTPQLSPQASPPGSTPVVGTSPTATPSSPPLDSSPPTTTPTSSTASPSTSSQHHLERSISAPEPATPPVMAPPRPPLQRSITRTELVKNYIRRETAVFFGIEEDCEMQEKAVWLERRKRLACRKYGQLRDEYQQPAAQDQWDSAARGGAQMTSAYATQQPRDSRPDVLPVGRDSTDLGTTLPRWSEPPVRRKESVARMTFGGLSYIVTALTRPRPRPTPRSRQYSRSYPLAVIPEASALVNEHTEETFFDRTETDSASAAPAAATPPLLGATATGDGVETTDAGFASSRDQHQLEEAPIRENYTARERDRPVAGWQRRAKVSSEAGPEVGCSRIWSRVLDRVFDNSDRRQYGMGFVGRFFGRSYKRSVRNESTVKQQLDNIEDYRPFFTYWITTVQVLILFMSLFCYGLGPIGFDLSNRAGEVLVTSLSLQQVEYQEPANFWIGPRAGDLIHLGAKFAPCMRKDAKIIKEIEKGREKERETACCIRNDDSGCVQSSQADCSKTISTWKKWSSGDSGPGGRISGSVCGLDPKHCESPASVAPYEWPDDITKWPICRKTKNQNFRPRDKVAEHMVCEVIGHPCCIGIHGMCRITTKEYCDFVRGYFHEEASLCAQVSCLDDVCGMIPFYFPEVPDQFYRLWTSLFLHAGIGHLCITLAIQWFLMRDLEKLTGPLRIGIIYMGSGIAGNLASAIFVPYRAEVGPAGAQFGLLACLIVEVLNVWPLLKHPNHALLKLFAITLVLFLFGLLPWVDNYAHLFGFIFGFLLSYALMPFVSFGPYDRHKKYALIWVCLLSALFLFLALVVLFYVIPVYDCEVCNYFTCLPLTRDFCASQNINFRREEPVV